MIPEVHACSGYRSLPPQRAYRDNAGALVLHEVTSGQLTVPYADAWLRDDA